MTPVLLCFYGRSSRQALERHLYLIACHTLTTMSTQTIAVKAQKVDYFSGATTKFIATIKASDLKGIEFPLNANVRRPSRNYVVNSILSSIRDLSGNMVIDAPIFAVAESVKVSGDNAGGSKIEIAFNETQGILDGGHRLEALRIANIDLGQYATDKVFFQLHIETGLDLQASRQKAIALNTSKNPARYEIMNAAGDFDWMKDAVDASRFPFIQYYSGQFPAGFEQDSMINCLQLNILPLLVNRKYNPHALGAIDRNRHPLFVSSSDGPFGGNSIDHLINANKKRLNDHGADLFNDLLFLYCLCLKTLDAAAESRPMPFIKATQKKTSATHLPDGTILKHVHPCRAYWSIMMSSFRLCMNEDFTWAINPARQQNKAQLLFKRLSTVMSNELRKPSRALYAAGFVSKDVKLWDSVYAKAEELIEGGLFK